MTTDEHMRRAVTFPAPDHKHHFPVNETILGEGVCVCGTTYAQGEADRAFTEALALVAAAYPLPDAEFLTGVQDGWHAVRRANAEWTAQHLGRDQTQAVCGKPVRLALNWPEYDGAKRPVSFDRCPECAWTVAGIKGRLPAEVERLMPSNEDRVILDGLMPDWMIAATAAAMLVEAVTEGHDDAVVEDEPEWIQLLAAISRHAPVILHREECNDGDCEHDGNCPASVACAACSLQAGSWAGEWEGTFRHECTIPAPCAVLTRLAEHAVEALAEAKRGAAEAEAWLVAELRRIAGNTSLPRSARQAVSRIAERVIDGEFDASPEESAAWAASPEGQETFRQLADDAVFGGIVRDMEKHGDEKGPDHG